jgi:hypothetical protein
LPLLSIDLAKDVLRGTPLEFTSLSEDKKRECVIIMLHCILNGPVGVNKVTTFPVVGAGSIKSILGVNCSNNQWKATCRPVATHIKSLSEWQQVVVMSQQWDIKKDLWPLWDRKEVAAK